MIKEFSISTDHKDELVDITREVEGIVSKSGVKQGLVNVYVPHATAAVMINENADPNICDDILEALGKIVREGNWRHDRIDGNAASHIKASIIGPSETVPIKDSRMLLGTWQDIFFCELDGPRRSRRIIITVMSD